MKYYLYIGPQFITLDSDNLRDPEKQKEAVSLLVPYGLTENEAESFYRTRLGIKLAGKQESINCNLAQVKLDERNVITHILK